VRPVSRVAAVVAAASLLVGCSSFRLPLPCDLMILAVPADSTLNAGDPLPAKRDVIAAPGDFDPTRSKIRTDPSGANVLDLQLRGDGVPRLAAHTAAHVGEQIAIVINGEIIAVPIVESSIPTGEISITPATIDNVEFAKRFEGCVH
jgi:preprotein translocase subunit SecD